MKRELKHDILAEKIWERLPEQDKQLRRVRRSITQRAGDFFAGTGSLAGETELLSWQALAGKLKLEPQEEDFIEQSWQQVLAKREEEQRRVEELEEQARREKKLRENAQRRSRIALALAVLAGLVLLFALQQCDKAKASEQRADLRAEEANQARQADSLKAIELGIALDKAEKAELMAKDSADYARHQEVIAKDALNESHRMAGRTVPVLLQEADNYILLLQYDTALVRAKAAWDLNAKRERLVHTFQEIAYFFTESNALDKAATALAYIGQAPKKSGNRQEILRAAVKKIDLTYWQDSLETRYYPEMVAVQGGTFEMGCDSVKLREFFGEDWSCPSNELPRHEVTLKPFRIARTETTVWQYYLYTQSDTTCAMPSEPSWGWKGNHPVINVSWYDVLAYANWLSKQRGEEQVYGLDIPGDANELRNQEYSIDWSDPTIVRWNIGGFRLPTEAEWEYAARGGSKSKGYLFAGGNSPEEVAVFDVGGGTRAVRSKDKNELGLYDMSGNVYEWCWDWKDTDFYSDPKARDNPRGSGKGSYRVLRGGSWINVRSYLRSSYRSDDYPRSGSYFVGFRLSQGY